MGSRVRRLAAGVVGAAPVAVSSIGRFVTTDLPRQGRTVRGSYLKCFLRRRPAQYVGYALSATRWHRQGVRTGPRTQPGAAVVGGLRPRRGNPPGLMLVRTMPPPPPCPGAFSHRSRGAPSMASQRCAADPMAHPPLGCAPALAFGLAPLSAGDASSGQQPASPRATSPLSHHSPPGPACWAEQKEGRQDHQHQRRQHRAGLFQLAMLPVP